VSPPDALTISGDVFDTCPDDIAKEFVKLPFPYEGKDVYQYRPASGAESTFGWIGNIGIQQSVKLNVVEQRPSEQNKAALISIARREVIDLGTALNTCSQYLVSTARPNHYHKSVISLLDRGVDYTCLILDPKSTMAKVYGKARGENLREKIEKSVNRLREFSATARGKRGKFRVFSYDRLPYFASIAIDRKMNGFLLLSSYLPHTRELAIGRADTPHFLLPEVASPTLFQLMDSCIDHYMRGARQLV
jgi:hypothetical protein